MLAEYDQSGLNRSFPPPRALVDRAFSVGCAFCSALKRAIESASMMGLDGKLTVDEVFNEAGVPCVFGNVIPVPVGFSLGLGRLLWLFGYARGCESVSLCRARAARAASIMENAAQEHGSVMLVAHGCINHFIKRHLKGRGWKPGGPFVLGYWEPNFLSKG